VIKPVQRLNVLLTLVCLALADTRVHRAQTPGAVYRSDTYAVSISMEKETVAASQPPIVSLAIRNMSDKVISRDDCSSAPRAWVQGEHGEPPTTYRERFSTQRLQPGEPDLACTLNMSWSLAPGETRKVQVLLQYLYDLHEPGKYSVYLEYPAPEGWLRTNTATFRVVPEDEHKQ
jgi:hypothetical protein